MGKRIRLIVISASAVLVAGAIWALQPPTIDVVKATAPDPGFLDCEAEASDPGLDDLRMRDGELNPLVCGNAIATSAPMWRSTAERAELERRALAGDTAAAKSSLGITSSQRMTRPLRAGGSKWLQPHSKQASTASLAHQLTRRWSVRPANPQSRQLGADPPLAR